MGRRKEEQRVGPSSSASLDAAASKTLSDGSQPPFGTVYNVRIGLNTRTQREKKSKKDMTHKPNYLVVYDLLLRELCRTPLR
jgi:hypothetical protein